MIKNGLIVSIQNYSLQTTQELAENCQAAKIAAIRTDNPIISEIPIIGLKKNKKKHYITTDIMDIDSVAIWADYIALDCRKENSDLFFLLKYCSKNNFKIIADIENINDVKNIINICKKENLKMPVSIATTFSDNNIDLIGEIKLKYNFHVIAEGGFQYMKQIFEAIKNGANNICIGAAISDIFNLTKKYCDIIKEVNDVLDSPTESSE